MIRLSNGEFILLSAPTGILRCSIVLKSRWTVRGSRYIRPFERSSMNLERWRRWNGDNEHRRKLIYGSSVQTKSGLPALILAVRWHWFEDLLYFSFLLLHFCSYSFVPLLEWLFFFAGEFYSMLRFFHCFEVSVQHGTEMFQALEQLSLSRRYFRRLSDLSNHSLLLDLASFLSVNVDPWRWWGIWTDHVCTFLLGMRLYP